MEKYHPIIENEIVKIYAKGQEKTIIVGSKEFTFQTKTKILKRKRMNIENELFKVNRLQHEGKYCGSLKKDWENKLWNKDRPRWEEIDKDKGVAFYKKGNRRMDFIEGEDEERGIKYKDIIIYSSDLSGETLVRNKKEPLERNKR